MEFPNDLECKKCTKLSVILKSANTLNSLVRGFKLEFFEQLVPAVRKEIDEFLNCSWNDDANFEATQGLLHNVKQELIEYTDVLPSELKEEEKNSEENKNSLQSKIAESKIEGDDKVVNKNKEEKSVENEVDDDLTITPKIAIKSAEALFEPEDCEEEVEDEDPFPLAPPVPSTSRSKAYSRKQVLHKSMSESAKDGNKWFNCTICEFSFTSKEKLVQHIDSHEITHECSQCQIGFYSLEEALQHNCEEYAQSNNDGVQDEENSDEFNSYSNSLMDEDEDNSIDPENGEFPVVLPYETEEITIDDEDEEEEEEKSPATNPGDSLMKCEHCDTYFLNEEELREHEEITHALGAIKDHFTGLVYKIPTENTYCCGLCGKSCKNLVAFNTHLRSRHKANPMKPPDNTCDVCGKAYDTLTRLRRHMSYQHGSRNPANADADRPGHPCDVCGKTFPSSYRLKHHYRTHTGEKPCKCEFCGKCFRNTSHLNDHRRIHTGERPYKCLHCGNSYIQGSQLKAHLRSRHNLTI